MTQICLLSARNGHPHKSHGGPATGFPLIKDHSKPRRNSHSRATCKSEKKGECFTFLGKSLWSSDTAPGAFLASLRGRHCGVTMPTFPPRKLCSMEKSTNYYNIRANPEQVSKVSLFQTYQISVDLFSKKELIWVFALQCVSHWPPF